MEQLAFLHETQCSVISYHVQILHMMLGGCKHNCHRFWFYNMFQKA